MVEIDVKIKADDLYDYMLMHAYHSASSLIGSGFGVFMVIIGAVRAEWLFIIAGIILILYLPWVLFIKSRRQVLSNPAFRQPLHYVMDEEGICVSQGEVTQKQAWGDMYKAISTKKSIILYTTRTNATILPKRELGEKRLKVIDMVSTYMPSNKVKVKR
jgi:hypothetical protein